MTALPTRSAATTLNHILVRNKIRSNVVAHAKLTTSAINIARSQRNERWKSFGHAERTFVNAGSAM